jgi:hypothetical protein
MGITVAFPDESGFVGFTVYFLLDKLEINTGYYISI